MFFQRGVVGDLEYEEGELEELPPYISEKIYYSLKGLSKEGQFFKSIPELVKDRNYEEMWTNILEAKNPWQCTLPGELEETLKPF